MRIPRCLRNAGLAVADLAGQAGQADRLRASLAGLPVARLRAGRMATINLVGPVGLRDHVSNVLRQSRSRPSKWV